jgi:uncharacterized protein (DUF924 family)
MNNFPIDLNNLYCFWYGFDKYFNISNKKIECVNLAENLLEDIWRDRWFAKEKQQKYMDEYLLLFKELPVQLKDYVPKNLAEKFACIILYDQISRNIYRGTAKAYETDAVARKLVHEIIAEYGENLTH